MKRLTRFLTFDKPGPEKITRITHLRYWAPSRQWSIRIEVEKEWLQPDVDREMAKFLLASYAEKGMLSKVEFSEDEFLLTLR